MRLIILVILSLFGAFAQACIVPNQGKYYDNKISIKQRSGKFYAVSVVFELENGQVNKDVSLVYIPVDESEDRKRIYKNIDLKSLEELVFGDVYVNPPEGYVAYIMATWGGKKYTVCGSRGIKKIETSNKVIHSEPKSYAFLVSITLALHYKLKMLHFRVG